MKNVLKALLITAAATGAAALVLKALDLDAIRASMQPDEDDLGFPGMDPENMSEEDVERMLTELAGQLGQL